MIYCSMKIAEEGHECMDKTKPVRINVETVERNADIMSSMTESEVRIGTIEKKGTGFLLSYDEIITEDGSQLERTQVKLHLSHERVMMMREGDYSTIMVFDRRQPYEGMYRTPFGEMPIHIQTVNVEALCRLDEGSVHLEYEVSIGDPSYRSYRILHLKYAPVSTGEDEHEESAE